MKSRWYVNGVIVSFLDYPVEPGNDELGLNRVMKEILYLAHSTNFTASFSFFSSSPLLFGHRPV
jgi:hypothetical protein